MTRRFEVSLTLVVTLACCGVASADPATPPTKCEAKSTIAGVQKSTLLQAFWAGPEDCNSIRAVLSRLGSTTKAGGRKLEGDKPQNVAAAEQERRRALADPAFKAQFDALLAAESDPLRRQLLEAALLDQYGHYLARDLLLRQISASLGLDP